MHFLVRLPTSHKLFLGLSPFIIMILYVGQFWPHERHLIGNSTELNTSDSRICQNDSKICPSDSRTDSKIDSRICREVFELRSHGVGGNASEMVALTVGAVSDAKDDRTFLRQLYYEVLGYENPSMVIKGVEDGRVGEANFTIKEKWRLSQVRGQLPHLPCRLREYVADDVTRCVRSRSRNQIHILYVGDSRIRQHVEVMIDLLRDLQLKITTYKGEVLSVEEFLGEKGMKFWSKYKHHFRVESLKVPGLLVEFKWAAFLDWGDAPRKISDHFSFWMKRMYGELDLTSWPDKEKETTPMEHQKTRVGAFEIISRLNASPKEDLPDIILLNTGAWLLTEYYQTAPLDAIDLSSVVVMDNLRQILSELADRTTVVWLAPDPFKEHISHILDDTGKYSYDTNAILEWQLNAQAFLKPPGILFWDTFLPISYASREDCMYFSSENVDFESLPKYSGFRPLLAWNCQERAHVGFEALGVAVQMVLNHLCNPHLGEGYCCSEMHK